MRKIFLMLNLLLLCVFLGFSFNPENYTFDNESVNITTYNFTLNNTSYIIYYFNDHPTFLYRVGDPAPLTNLSLIKDILFSHYKEKYYPSESELDQLRFLVEEFNKSRNDGTVLQGRFFNIEEMDCRKSLGENLPPPTDLSIFNNDIYYFYSVYICSNFGEEIGCNDANDIYPEIKSFFDSSYGIDRNLNTILQLIENMTPQTSHQDLMEMEDLMEEIEQYVENIKNNKFRYPDTGNDECPDCYGVCAELQINESAVDEFYDLVDSLQEKTTPLGEYESIAEEIYNSTVERLTYVENKNLREFYTQRLNQILQKWYKEKNETDEALGLLHNKTLSALRQRLDELVEEISNNIEQNNFTELDEKLNNLNNLVQNLPKNAIANKDLYFSIVAEANKVENLFILAEAYGIDVSDLKEEKNYLDVNFVPGIDVDKALEFKERYKSLAEKLVERIEANKAQQTLWNSIAKVVRGVTEGFYSFIYDMPYYQRLDLLEKFPILLSIVTAFTFSSIVVWLAICVYAKLYKKIEGRSKIVVALLIAIVVLSALVFGGLTYFVYDKFISEGNVGDFLFVIRDMPYLTIVVDFREGYSKSMDICADTTADAARSYGKNVTVIRLYEDSCSVDTNNYEGNDICFVNLKRPYIIFELDQQNVTYKSVNAGEISLTVRATDAYYAKCPLPYFFEVIGGKQ